jgi:hypothetical protein
MELGLGLGIGLGIMIGFEKGLGSSIEKLCPDPVTGELIL